MTKILYHIQIAISIACPTFLCCLVYNIEADQKEKVTGRESFDAMSLPWTKPKRSHLLIKVESLRYSH